MHGARPSKLLVLIHGSVTPCNLHVLYWKDGGQDNASLVLTCDSLLSHDNLECVPRTDVFEIRQLTTGSKEIRSRRPKPFSGRLSLAEVLGILTNNTCQKLLLVVLWPQEATS